MRPAPSHDGRNVDSTRRPPGTASGPHPPAGTGRESRTDADRGGRETTLGVPRRVDRGMAGRSRRHRTGPLGAGRPLCRDGDVVGFYALSPGTETVELEHVWVSPEEMGRGIGEHLFEHAVGEARSRGASRLEIARTRTPSGSTRDRGPPVSGRSPRHRRDGRSRCSPRSWTEWNGSVARASPTTPFRSVPVARSRGHDGGARARGERRRWSLGAVPIGGSSRRLRWLPTTRRRFGGV